MKVNDFAKQNLCCIIILLILKCYVQDKLCSQSTLSGSALEEEPWQSFLSELGSQQEILKILNIENIKKRAAARLLAKKRVPFLAAVLHYINPSTPDPCIILRDTTGKSN